jgi:hypothetical protein
MKYTRVENEPNFIRDNNSRGILNTDNVGLTAYKMQKRARLNQENKINRLTEDVNELKSDISEIKNLLVSFLDK